jgi:hypothetical protein
METSADHPLGSSVARAIRKGSRIFAGAMALMLLPILLTEAWGWWRAYQTRGWLPVNGRIVEGGHHGLEWIPFLVSGFRFTTGEAQKLTAKTPRKDGCPSM